MKALEADELLKAEFGQGHSFSRVFPAGPCQVLYLSHINKVFSPKLENHFSLLFDLYLFLRPGNRGNKDQMKIGGSKKEKGGGVGRGEDISENRRKKKSQLTGLGKSQRLTNTVPASTCSAKASPMRVSPVQIDAVRPNSQSFISRSASSSSPTFITGITGPNVSSFMTSISWLTPVKRVGLI